MRKTFSPALKTARTSALCFAKTPSGSVRESFSQLLVRNEANSLFRKEPDLSIASLLQEKSQFGTHENQNFPDNSLLAGMYDGERFGQDDTHRHNISN